MSDFDTTNMAEDMGEMLDGLAQSSVVFSSRRHRGQPITARACIGDLSGGNSATEEGVLGEDDVSLTCLASAFSGAWTPQTGDIVTIDGQSYRIRRPRWVPGDVSISFDCEAVAK